MNILELINKKRLGQVLTEAEIDFLLSAYMKNEMADYQMSSFLMAVCLQGMNDEETYFLTKAMINSGDKLDLSSIPGIKVDKHSTGGVGDKTTLILAPLVASCGIPVVKMSGRSLGFSGGTIDKVESIPGFKTNISLEECVSYCQKIGIVLASQTGNLVPADKKLYALRDVSGTVESISLIASSIMSKKIASGADKIVIDLKVGNGAFMKNLDDASKLANLMVKIGELYNRQTVCLITDMSQPLGYAVGNTLEVLESMEVLNGRGPKDVKKLVIQLGALMVSLAQNIDLTLAIELVSSKLSNGQAYAKFIEFVTNQEGRLNEMKIAANKLVIKSPKEGYVKTINCEAIGELVRQLGGGRYHKDDIVDHGVGLILNKKIGNKVLIDETLVTVIYNQKEVNPQTVIDCFEIVNEPITEPTLIDGIVNSKSQVN